MVRDPIPLPDEWSAAKRDATASQAGSLHASLSAALRDEIFAAARAGVPNEACGLLVSDQYAGAGGVARRYVPLRNAAESPYRYFIDPDEQLRAWLDLDDADEIVWAIVHSHVASDARPSQTDVGLAFYPDSLYLICSLADPDQPVVRAWSIRDNSVAEVSLDVDG